MKYFIRLNVLSILYAFMMFAFIQLMANVYRFSRLTGWTLDTVNELSFIAIVIIFVMGTFLHFLLSRRWLKGRKSALWTAILWIPYFILFVYFISPLFPITYEGDTPNPVVGLIAIAALIIYPFYILIINLCFLLLPESE